MFENYEDTLKEKGYNFIIGIDEAGRGPLAGPVVASAVALKSSRFTHTIADSKKLTQKKREQAFNEIYQNAYVGIGIINEWVIDECNILNATYHAMNNAVRQLVNTLPLESTQQNDFFQKVYLLVDGNRFKPTVPYRLESVVKGDAKIMSIACASIIAKVTRDRILKTYDDVYPQYGFRQHKGYPTKQHQEAIKEFGLSDIHRKSFGPCH